MLQHYPYFGWGDSVPASRFPNTPQQANATREGYRLNLQVIRAAALRKNIPFWNYFVRSEASAS